MDAKLLSCGVFLYLRHILQGGQGRLWLPGAASQATEQDTNQTAEKHTQELITRKPRRFPETTALYKNVIVI